MDQELDAAIVRLRTVVLARLARQSGHGAEEKPGLETPSASPDERENLVRSRWQSFLQWFRGE